MTLNLVNLDKALLLQAVNDDFVRMSKAVYNSIGISLTVAESYKYEWEILEELRTKVKNTEVRDSLTQLGFAADSLIVNSATNKVSLLDLVRSPTQEAVAIYNNLKTFISSLPSNEFEPPLGPDFTSVRNINEIVYSIPNYPQVDPRRSGRIVRIGPKSQLNPTTIRHLVLNAGKYGFIFYGPLDPSIWYWRGDKLPFLDPITGQVRDYFTPFETAATFSLELVDLLPTNLIPTQLPPQPQQIQSGPVIINSPFASQSAEENQQVSQE